MIDIKINGESVLIQGGSLNIQKNITDYDTLTFNVITFENKKWFKEGLEVELFFQGVKRFGGYIHKVREVGALHNYLLHQIQVKGYEYLADKIPIAKAYQFEWSGDIVAYIVNDFLYQEGITIAYSERGIRLNDIKFGYVSAWTALKRLAEKNNFYLRIDENKKIHFRSKKSNIAPFALNWNNVISNSVRVEKGNPAYRNTQYLVGSKAKTDTLIAEFKGDGKNKTFTLGFPLAERPKAYVSINGGPFEEKLVGFKEITNTGYFFYFSMNDNVIVQDKDAPVLTDNDIVKFEYKGLYDVVIVNKLPYEIEKRKQLDKGTGIVGQVINKDIIGLDNAIQENLLILNKYGTQEGFIIEYETDKDGLEPGMLQPIHLPEHNLVDTEGLITHVRIRDVDQELRYSVRVVNGPFDEDWVAFFSKKEKDNDFNLIEGSELIQPVYSFEKTWQQTEFPNLFSSAVYPGKNTFPGPSLYPALKTGQKVKFLAYFINDIETGRVPIIKQTEEGDIVYSLCLLGLDIEGLITKLAWVGGATASEQVGTGIYLDIQNVTLNKTRLEVFQIEKIDRKGW
ncbi:hypothetical protein SAMN04489735_100262 [Aneurinibacillus thermoaerophilus]|uniref:Uncharacterized protein n=1 Tax=Aneurinibacillus thermoaerophilus TaxID=143495 RepID=A0A1G7WQ85_ANETH|nr:hypothetical protein [Aneurinibacillus thermoaerophilus]SDG74155.1 hypothetical protein SAMN04489735_100262 [Aneurinibacillus thermoaerophilus]